MSTVDKAQATNFQCSQVLLNDAVTPPHGSGASSKRRGVGAKGGNRWISAAANVRLGRGKLMEIEYDSHYTSAQTGPVFAH